MSLYKLRDVFTTADVPPTRVFMLVFIIVIVLGRPLFLLTESGGVYIQGTILIGISIASFRLAGKAAPIER